MSIKQRLIFVVTITVIAVGAGFWIVVNRHEGTHDSLVASGTVEATEAQLGFQTPGRIEDIMVHEGDSVKAGVELAHLDRAETQARRQQTLAHAAAARALLQELERGFRSEEVAQGRAALAVARERFNDAQRDLDRSRLLHEGGAVSKEAYDKAVLAFDVAKNLYDQAQEQMRILETGPRKEKIEAQRAELMEAEAAVRTIDAILANMTIRSPFDGVVTVRHREPGEIGAAGSPVLTIMNPNDRWVRVYIPENRIGAIRLGQSSKIISDTYPDKSYRGELVFISTQAEFTPKTVQTTEERVKLVYAIKVRIADDPTNDLKPGMPADVHLELAKP